MNRSQVSGVITLTVAASEEDSEPDSPDLRSGLFHLIHAGMHLEA
jgi:hypothetical protein